MFHSATTENPTTPTHRLARPPKVDEIEVRAPVSSAVLLRAPQAIRRPAHPMATWRTPSRKKPTRPGADHRVRLGRLGGVRGHLGEGPGGLGGLLADLVRHLRDLLGPLLDRLEHRLGQGGAVVRGVRAGHARTIAPGTRVRGRAGRTWRRGVETCPGSGIFPGMS